MADGPLATRRPAAGGAAIIGSVDSIAAWLQLGAVLEDGEPAHFGAPQAEARAAAAGEDALIVPLQGCAPLRVTGADRAAFLHGQLSNAVQGLAAGVANHTLQLNARGQVVGEGTLCVRGDDLFLAVDDGRGPDVRASLEAHIVFDDVTLTDLSGTLAALTVQGGRAEVVAGRVLGALPPEGRFVEVELGGARALAVRRRRSAAGGVDVHVLAGQLPGVVAALAEAGGALTGWRAAALARVVAGVPSAALDGGPAALPQELGLEGAVSSRKGCYLGQEIMARIEARGAVRRRLARVRLGAGGAELLRPEAGGDRSLRLEGRVVGRLGTVARDPDGGLVGLAVVRRDVPVGARMEVHGSAAVLEGTVPAPPGGSPEGARGDGREEGAVQSEPRSGPEL